MFMCAFVCVRSCVCASVCVLVWGTTPSQLISGVTKADLVWQLGFHVADDHKLLVGTRRPGLVSYREFCALVGHCVTANDAAGSGGDGTQLARALHPHTHDAVSRVPQMMPQKRHALT
jgi:hypothetical protein